MNYRAILIVVLILATLAALAATPVGAGFGLRSFACDFGPPTDWVATIVKLTHLVLFGGLATLAFLVFRSQPIWIPIIFMIVVTGAVEIEEGIFDFGRCKMRDMIPNVIAIGIGWVLATLVARLVPARWLNA